MLVGEDLLQLRPQRLALPVLVQHRFDLLAQFQRGPAKVGFKDCPTFIREGTPSGFSTMSTGVPSDMYGMSSWGSTRETTPLFP